MRIQEIVRPTILAILLFSGLSCYPTTVVERNHVMRVVVGLPPAAFIVDYLTGDSVLVQTLLKQGADPHTFEPSPSQVVKIGKADLFITLGIPFEARITEKIAASGLNCVIVNSDSGIVKRRLKSSHRHDEHLHTEHGAKESFENWDPHIWLSPVHIGVIATNIAHSLSSSDPSRTEYYNLKLKKLTAEIETLDVRLRSLLSDHVGESVYVYHPAFGYFCDEYGLRQQAVEIEGKSPTPKQIQTLIKQAKAESVKTVFVQNQQESNSVQTIANAIGAKIVTVNPLAYDLFNSIETFAIEIERALNGQVENGQ